VIQVNPRLKDRYKREIVSQIMEEDNLENIFQVPQVEKVVLNMGLGEAVQDPKVIESGMQDLAMISGQKPQIRRAKKSIAGFKLRANMPIGCKVTLRGKRMYEFLDRLLSVVIPRIRDFRGLSPKSFDGRGNYSLGITEQIVFPEIDYDKVDKIRGLDITIVTTAKDDQSAYKLLKKLGFPFRER
jgi:large subunit ribosomal protein L5